MKNLPLFLLLALPFCLSAQTVRKLHYYPDGRDIVCVNGEARFTRALYATNSGFRVETSDRPVFAIYQPKKESCNVRFVLRSGEVETSLDSTAYCEARYRAGLRTYTLRDESWDGGEVRVEVQPDRRQDRGIWRFEASGFQSPVFIDAVVCEGAVQKFTRAGDIVKNIQEGCFEAAEHPENVRRASFAVETPVYFALDGGAEVSVCMDSQNALSLAWEQADKDRENLASMVEISTPDPYLNTIGGNMVIAADGAWDGETWLHGAVGWHSQLPGWRAAYMGDFLGMPERQRSHFDAYAESQVDDVPVTLPHEQDEENNLARGAYVWGTPMYSNGYICRSPHDNHQFHHYDMNLPYIDELLWHFQFDADTSYMRKMWPVLKSHLAWEKNTWDPDGDSLYDAYCCIWASDALQYSSGAGTHSSAYNYRANLLAAKIAAMIGEDPKPYQEEAEKILSAMNARLWMPSEGVWAEFQDFLGQKRLHESPALWTIYTAIDSEACSPQQAYEATGWIGREIPHIPFVYEGEEYEAISTSSWMPYEWSLNNVAMAETMHTALAYYEAGRAEEAYRLLKGNIVDFMYAGCSPGNFGQLSYLDRNTGEGYRDFSDVTGISSRAIIQGLFGITPQALDGKCYIRPGFPSDWKIASIHTPYLKYSFERKDGKDIYHIKQNFVRPLQIVLLQNIGGGKVREYSGTDEKEMTIVIPSVPHPVILREPSPSVILREQSDRRISSYGTECMDIKPASCEPVGLEGYMNASVTDIFRQEYLSPRSPYTTLCLPKQGIGDWCSTKRTADVDDSFLRSSGGRVDVAGVPFVTPSEGDNIIYASLWDNYPDSVEVPLTGKAGTIYLLMAGSTNPMQSRFDNGKLTVRYADGSTGELILRNPDNWCPIEQDYDEDGLAFHVQGTRPYRLSLKTGNVSRNLAKDMNIKAVASSDEPSSKVPQLSIPGGAAQMLEIKLDKGKELESLSLAATANDVVIGILGITLER